MIAASFGGVHDFFHSSTWYVIRNLAIFFLLVFWIATIYWVHKDAKRRIEDPLIVWVVTAIGVVPFIGPLIYMLFRPPEYLEDVRERELEIKAMEKRLGGRDLHCPVCRAEVEEVPEPAAALARARELGRPVLVTGSLYLLADLSETD